MNLRTVGVGILCLFLVGGTLFLVLQPQPAEAAFSSESVSGLADYVADRGVALNLRLIALDALRKKTDSTVESELESLAKGDDFQIAVFATTALGKRKTTTANAKLRSLVTSTKLGKDVRRSAMSALAAHFKSSSDLTWLKSQTASDADLKAHCEWLKTYVYGL